jgi:hypothetical protein
MTHLSPFPSSLLLPSFSPSIHSSHTSLSLHSVHRVFSQNHLHSNCYIQNAWHNPHLLHRLIGREPSSPDLRLGQAGRARCSHDPETTGAICELGAEDVEVDDEEGPVTAGWTYCVAVRLSPLFSPTWGELTGRQKQNVP